MTAKVKSVLSVAGEAVETAAGYALLAVGIYTAVFVDLTGGGSLWNILHHVQTTAQEGIVLPNATRVIKVPVRHVEEKVHEDRMLAVFDAAPVATTVAAVYAAPDAPEQRPSAALTDVPAEPTSGKSWKKGLRGELKRFTVYGKGEQTSSASVTAAAARSEESYEASRAVVAAAGTAAGADTTAASRPGMSSRMSRGALSASDTSRNIR